MTDPTTASTRTYQVTGMTCQHCVNAVTEEVSGVPGVTAVRVDLERGELAVTSSTDVERSALAAAVDEAGYTLV
ncbi:heavy-metal-associated domain-containing protein [Microlunatus capsulatus]|uniref:Copper ion binding protein n=1 Tax=Microlunatus capsulatus TaxID=99117 RepID=A0ABS4Z8E3_9ACTN|nr:heavy-metal-associated domain-containing protein [Microlunatus capsulatus]MBP2417239.1 copper ion binding protein [Microlunatus capsulatus]